MTALTASFGIGLALGLVVASIWETWREFRRPDEWEDLHAWSEGIEALERTRRKG